MNRFRAHLAALLSMAVVAGIAAADGRVIVPVAGSTPGVNGANFRTEMQLHNPSAVTMRGALMFLPQATTLKLNELTQFPYEIAPKQTLRYADILGAMG